MLLLRITCRVGPCWVIYRIIRQNWYKSSFQGKCFFYESPVELCLFGLFIDLVQQKLKICLDNRNALKSLFIGKNSYFESNDDFGRPSYIDEELGISFI